MSSSALSGPICNRLSLVAAALKPVSVLQAAAWWQAWAACLRSAARLSQQDHESASTSASSAAAARIVQLLAAPAGAPASHASGVDNKLVLNGLQLLLALAGALDCSLKHSALDLSLQTLNTAPRRRVLQKL